MLESATKLVLVSREPPHLDSMLTALPEAFRVLQNLVKLRTISTFLPILS